MHVLKSRSKRILNGLGNLSLMTLLMLWLTACATKPVPVPAVLPSYLYDGGCGAPDRLTRGATNADLVRYVRGLQDAVVSCEVDRAAIRDWVGKVGKL